MMDEKSFKVQIRHIRSCLASLRLFDLHELQHATEQHGSQADQDLIAALLLALETLPDEH